MPLTSGLVEFWKLNEVSGTRNGSLAAFNLADSGATAQGHFNPEFDTTAESNGCAVFNQSTNLSVASAAALQIAPASPLTLSAWARLDSQFQAIQTLGIVGKDSSLDGSLREYNLGYNSLQDTNGKWTGNWRWDVGSAVLKGWQFNSEMRATVGMWTHLVGIYYPPSGAATLGSINFWINNSNALNNPDPTGTSLKNGILTTAPVAGTAKFAVGARVSTAGNTANLWFGGVCNVGLWNRVLDQKEIGDLYNGGITFTYPFAGK